MKKILELISDYKLTILIGLLVLIGITLTTTILCDDTIKMSDKTYEFMSLAFIVLDIVCVYLVYVVYQKEHFECN